MIFIPELRCPYCGWNGYIRDAKSTAWEEYCICPNCSENELLDLSFDEQKMFAYLWCPKWYKIYPDIENLIDRQEI